MQMMFQEDYEEHGVHIDSKKQNFSKILHK